jgi:serine protease Do
MAAAVNPTTSFSISIGGAFASVAEWLRRCTVRISNGRGSQGSGVIWRDDGLIVTNAHVATADVLDVELPDGRLVGGQVLARDVKSDLAALRIVAPNLTAAITRSAGDLRPGELVMAVGNPWNGEGAVSFGLVHATVGKGSLIMSDIRLAPGNSGGPLADARGYVVGINSMVVNGLGCALTTDRVWRSLRKGI